MISTITCMALAIYFEARNQPIAGQLAVAHVISNRVVSKHHPNTVCEVIMQGPTHPGGVHPVKHRCQFSFFCDGKKEIIHDYDAWQTAIRVAVIGLGTGIHEDLDRRDQRGAHFRPEGSMGGSLPTGGVDVSEGATHYHAVNVSPKWRYTMRMTTRIGDHLFYKP